MSHCGSEKVGGRCEQMRLHTQTWEEAVSYWSFKGATVSLLSRYVERNGNADECSSRRDSVPITRWESSGFAAPPLFPISFLVQPTSGFIHMYQKKRDDYRGWAERRWKRVDTRRMTGSSAESLERKEKRGKQNGKWWVTVPLVNTFQLPTVTVNMAIVSISDINPASTAIGDWLTSKEKLEAAYLNG